MCVYLLSYYFALDGGDVIETWDSPSILVGYYPLILCHLAILLLLLQYGFHFGSLLKAPFIPGILILLHNIFLFRVHIFQSLLYCICNNCESFKSIKSYRTEMYVCMYTSKIKLINGSQILNNYQRL